MGNFRIGIDLGGTKIEAIALDADGSECAQVRIETPRSYDGTISALVELVAALERDIGSGGTVGIGIPGSISPSTGLVKNANSTWLIGHALEADLQTALDRPVRVMNDANCFALSEATDGAAAGAEIVFGVIVGTGVGGGLVIGGQVAEGHQRIGGEWGHNPLPWPRAEELPGPACYCGRSGCIETFVSGPGMAGDHERVTGTRLPTREIAALAEGGDDAAQETLRRYADRLARGLATVVNIVDPNVVVLGGGMSNLPGLADSVQERLLPFVFSDTCTTRIVGNRHGDSSGVRGAAWLWPGAA
jgi:fructokinase